MQYVHFTLMGDSELRSKHVLSVLILALFSLMAVAQEPETLHSWSHRNWYSDKLSGGVYISATGRYLEYRNEGRTFIHDTQTGKTTPLSELCGFESTPLSNWLPGVDKIEIKGRKDGELQRAVFDLASGELSESPLPRNIFSPSFSLDGRIRAGIEPRNRRWGLYIDRDGETSMLPALNGYGYNAYDISPDGKMLAYTLMEESGWASL